MKVESIVLGSIGTNCYIVTNEETKECFAVDMAECPQEYVNYIKNNGLEMKALFLTHGHFDHAMAAQEVAEQYGIKIYAHETEKETLETPQINLSGMIGRTLTFHADCYVKDGAILNLAGFEIRVLHTPGHTQGGVCYYIEEEKALFSGDTLFLSLIHI